MRESAGTRRSTGSLRIGAPAGTLVDGWPPNVSARSLPPWIPPSDSALVEYAERMWFRHEDALVATITEEFGLTKPSDEIRFYVRFALNIQLVATRDTDSESTIDAGFRVLDEGWARYQDEITS